MNCPRPLPSVAGRTAGRALRLDRRPRRSADGRQGDAGRRSGAPDGQRLDEDVRRTDVGFWDETHWINGLLAHYASLANRETWNLDISLMAGVQYAIYTEQSFFQWHTDELAQPYGPLAPARWIGLNRKLSVIVNLTDPQAYEGGDVQLRDRLGNPIDDRRHSRARHGAGLSLERGALGHAGDRRGTQLARRLVSGAVAALAPCRDPRRHKGGDYSRRRSRSE